jgi:hypothetical protein
MTAYETGMEHKGDVWRCADNRPTFDASGPEWLLLLLLLLLTLPV